VNKHSTLFLGKQSSHLEALPGPEDITRQELPNGIVILARANFNSPSVVVQGYFPAGSLFDPIDKLGLADFTATALTRGTAERDFQAIYEALESVGASLGFSGGTHSAGFSGRALAEDLDMLLGLLGEVLRQPVFPGEPVERLRAQILTSLAIRAQDTAEMASLTFDRILYDGHPYSRPEDGFPETVERIVRQDLLDFHRLHYGPRGLTLAVVGAVEPQAVVEKTARALGDWITPQQPLEPSLPPVRNLDKTVSEKVTITGKSQADLLMGTIGPVRRSPDYLAASLGNSIFGQFGMYGRIGDVVREQAGLAYYAYSSISGGLGPGPWYVTAGVDPGNVGQVQDLVRKEIARLVNEPVTRDELEDSQSNYIGRLPLSMESNGGVAGALINLERYSLGLDYYRRYAGLIASITPDEVLEAARRYLDPDKLGIAVAGP
jgi:zinc protease